MTIEQIAADKAHYARMAVMTAEAAARRAARIARAAANPEPARTNYERAKKARKFARTNNDGGEGYNPYAA